MTNRTGGSRRHFLRVSATGLAGLTMLPRMRRTAHAAPGAGARARRVLVLNLFGGIRSSAAFLATDRPAYNPYGLIADTGAPFALGRLLDDTPPGTPTLDDPAYVLGPDWRNARVPRLREITDRFAVLGTWSTVRGDHYRARVEEPSGDPAGGEPGLLTRIVAGLAASRGSDLPVPAFHIAPFARFGGGEGGLARHTPVPLASWQSLPSSATADPIADAATGAGWSRDELMRERFDRARVASRRGLGLQLTENVTIHRRAARTVGARLARPDFAVGDLDGSGTAALGTVDLAGAGVPLTNAMLHQLFTRCLGPGDIDSKAYRDYALDAALAVRMLQIDSPAVVLEVGNFDFHSGERTMASELYSFLGRLWATLWWLLARVPDPSGEGSLLDRTLVLTMSDFGRDQMGPTGWNSGEGSDHGSDYACSYLAHAIMGAGVRGGRLVAGVRTDTYDGRDAAVQIAPPQLLATTLHALGLDPFDDGFGLPTAGRVVEELWA